MTQGDREPAARERVVSRRKVLGSLGVASAGLAVATTAGALDRRAVSPSAAAGDTVPFYGANQAGISTPEQERLQMAAFDVIAEDRTELIGLLKLWSKEAEAMTRGEPVGPPSITPLAPPRDTGEALGLAASRLSVTFGFGATLFQKDGRDRFGLAGRRPEALADLPIFPGDELDPARGGGDLVVQACADDPVVAFHAIRNLARLGRGTVVMRWSQLGFGRTSSTGTAQVTPRNLMGFKDGTNNLKREDVEGLAADVWVGPQDYPSWMHDGTYMVTRRIRMLIETWDRTSLDDQQLTIGRVKDSGAPLGGRDEFDGVDLAARSAAGDPVIPIDAHIRLAAPATNSHEKILRRGYSFTDGIDPVTGQLDAGLFFICFQRDPHRQFVPIQQRLGMNDALNEYIKHVASGSFAIPPGTSPGGFVGETLVS
jgi:deferrochelatase/peroxidase EfeB